MWEAAENLGCAPHITINHWGLCFCLLQREGREASVSSMLGMLSTNPATPPWDYSSLFRVPVVSPDCPLIKLNGTRQVECRAWCWCKVAPRGIVFLSLLLGWEGRMATRPAADPVPTLCSRSMSFSNVRQRPHPSVLLPLLLERSSVDCSELGSGPG